MSAEMEPEVRLDLKIQMAPYRGCFVQETVPLMSRATDSECMEPREPEVLDPSTIADHWVPLSPLSRIEI